MTDSVYTERARLVAFLASVFPSVISYNDSNEPDWPVIYIESSLGQMSWHISPSDFYLFDKVEVVPPEEVKWDGHTTEEKYKILRKLTEMNYGYESR